MVRQHVKDETIFWLIVIFGIGDIMAAMFFLGIAVAK